MMSITYAQINKPPGTALHINATIFAGFAGTEGWEIVQAQVHIVSHE
jgi:hypothetical protein